MIKEYIYMIISMLSSLGATILASLEELHDKYVILIGEFVITPQELLNIKYYGAVMLLVTAVLTAIKALDKAAGNVLSNSIKDFLRKHTKLRVDNGETDSSKKSR